MADPKLPINCPICGLPLVYVRTDGATLVYRCTLHGAILVEPDGKVRQQPA